MNDEEFVGAVKDHVFDAAINDVMSGLASPPGRRPSDASLDISNWYHGQNEEAQAHIRQCVKEGVHSALFGFFCVLDGVRLIHEDLRNGQLRLVFRNDEQQILLSDNQNFSDLHDILNATDGVL